MNRPSPFEIHRELENGAARLTVVGELDIATVPELERAARALLGSSLQELLIDISGVSFIDSSGLRLLIELSNDAGAGGWTLKLTPPPAEILTIFRISGVEENLPFLQEGA
jgi:anti-sigma B factor antagonist